MYHSKFIALSGMVSLVFSVSSCLAPAEQEIIREISESQSSKLSLTSGISSPWQSTTRAGEESVPVPIMYYVFDGSGTCVAAQLVNDVSTKAELSVERGSYKIFALCGDFADRPTLSSAKLNEAFEVSTNSDMCLGQKSVVIDDYGMSKDVTIGVSHLFSAISLSIKDVPSSVTGIKATFCDVYDCLTLEGTFSGMQDKVLSMSKSADVPTTWYIPETLIYPCVKTPMKVMIEITSSDGSVQVVNTTTEYVLESGKKVSLTSQFRTLSVVAAGVVLNNGWTSVSGDIDFWNGSNSGSDNNADTGSGNTSEPESGESGGNAGTDEQETPPSSNPTAVYEIGQRFGETDAFILDIETDDATGAQTSLLLQSTKVLYGTNLSEANNFVSSYKSSTGGTIDWRIPTMSELKLLMQNYSIDDFIAKATEYGIKNSNITTTSKFGCMDNVYYKGIMWNDPTISANCNYVIPVATYIIQ